MKHRLPRILRAALLASLVTPCPALTTLFSDDFAGQSGTPTNWYYGNNSTAQTPGTGDSMQVVGSSGAEVLKIIDANTQNDPTPIAHTFTPVDFAATGQKVLQLNVDMKVVQNAAAYRIGMYNTVGTSSVTIGAAYHVRIYPSQATNNVNILTYAATGVVQDNLVFSANQADLQGTHTLSLQVDFTNVAAQPTIRVYSNGTLLAQTVASATGGFRPTSTDGKIVRVMVQGTSGPSGASYEVDNVRLVAFDPGALLLGNISGGAVNRMILGGHNLLGAKGDYIFTNAVEPAPADVLQTGVGIWNPTTNAPVSTVTSRLAGDLGAKALRFPGGCLSHGYNWKSTIGPIASRERSDWKFGLDEFLRLCEQMGAEPVITCSDYVLPAADMPLHLAQLVEYVNAPADAAHPWAMQRAANGHPAPYGVKYFELGNESSHGNHYLTPARTFTADQYATYALNSMWAMRAVDPAVQIGIVTLPGAGDDAFSQWNATVLQAAGRAADFAILHIYSPRYAPGDSAPNENNLMQACMAAAEQVDYHLQDYKDIIFQTTGRNMAMAVTEYNAIFSNTDVGVKPYRFSYGAALHAADLVRVFSKPGNNIAMANYWQVLNSFFGMFSVATRPAVEPMTERPAYPLYRLWGKHFGATLTNVQVATPTMEFGGERRVGQATGTQFLPEEYLSSVSLIGFNSLPNFASIPNVTASKNADTLTVNFNGYSGQKWPTIGSATPPPAAAGRRVNYELTYDGRYTATSGASGPFNALQQDSRGWTATQSSVAVGPVVSSSWRTFQDMLHTLKDAPGTTTLLELNAPSAISGTLEIKNPTINIYTQEVYPAYSLLTALGSTSADGNTRYLIVFNKSDLHIPAPITLNNFVPVSAKLWEVNGPNLAATSGVSEVKSGVALPVSGSSPISYVFPAHSMTAFEFYR